MFAKRCQYYAQPLSPVSWERLVQHKQLRGDHWSEIICITCAHAVFTTCRYYSRAAFISFRASNCAATIQGQGLFEGGVYSKKCGSCEHQ